MSLLKQLAASTLVFVAASPHFTSGCRADDFKSVFVREYPDALRALEDYYGRMQFTSVRERQETDYELSYASKWPLFRASTRLIRSAVESDERFGITDVFLHTTDNKTVMLTNFAGTDKYVVSRPQVGESVMHTLRMDWFPAYAPYCIGPWRVAELLEDDGFELTHVSSSASRPLEVRVEWKSHFVDDGHAVGREGWFVVQPENSWVIIEYELAYRNPGQTFFCYRGEIEYANSIRGRPPAVVEARYWREVGDERTQDSRTDFRNIELTFRRLRDREFTLAAFGIGDSAKRGWTGPLIIAALASLVLAGVFRWLAARRLAV